jgi:hypothetical protein
MDPRVLSDTLHLMQCEKKLEKPQTEVEGTAVQIDVESEMNKRKSQ